jgi:hypothetical protein
MASQTAGTQLRFRSYRSEEKSGGRQAINIELLPEQKPPHDSRMCFPK